LVSDLPPGNGKIDNLFYSKWLVGRGMSRIPVKWFNDVSPYIRTVPGFAGIIRLLDEVSPYWWWVGADVMII
jgi:hypothetical protein